MVHKDEPAHCTRCRFAKSPRTSTLAHIDLIDERSSLRLLHALDEFKLDMVRCNIIVSLLIESSSNEWINPEPAWLQDGGTCGCSVEEEILS